MCVALFSLPMLYLDVTHQDIMISGKGKAVSKLRSDNFFVTKVSAFMGSVSVKEDIVKVGDCAIVAPFEFSWFIQKTSTSSVAVEPHTLPPTSSAAKFHSLQVYQKPLHVGVVCQRCPFFRNGLGDQ